MFLSLEEMRKRKNATYRLDSLIIEKIAEHAKNNDISANSWLESYLFNSLKAMGIINPDEIPLGETRGGDRRSKDIEQSD
ncbi:MAG: hypothetical protein KME22_08275 [Hassallia sp. WJT32-NPBG1]|jgi:hypothetical protein|nr:hypothetical protein [Hassallia sp. WJT32-NPBG1]